MKVILTFAALTLREAARRRLLVAVILLTLLAVGSTAFGFSRLPTLQCRGVPCPESQIRLAGAQLLILVMFMFHSVFALGAVFVAATAIIGEVESGVALAILPRPISRAQLVTGKWLGLATLVAIYAAAASAIEFASVYLVLGYSPPDPLIATVYLVASAIALMSLALLASTRLAPTTGGVVALVLFGLAWLGGVAQAVGLAFDNLALANLGTFMSLAVPTDGLWRGAIYHLEPPAVLAVFTQLNVASGNPFLALAPPPSTYLIWAACWIAGMLGLAILSFNQRDL